MELKENDVVMCTVKKIEGTTVFLELEDSLKGSMVMSEVAAGRIRNLREYVYPNKKVVCKVLKITPDHLELSLRRVTGKEREEIQSRFKKERTFINMIKAIVNNSEEVIAKIKKDHELWSFFDNVREDPSLLEKFVKKSESDAIAKLLQEKKEKSVKKTIILKSMSESGLLDIKEILTMKNTEVHYMGSSQFSISVKAKDFKEAQHQLESAIKQIESKSKEKKVFFELKDE